MKPVKRSMNYLTKKIRNKKSKILKITHSHFVYQKTFKVCDSQSQTLNVFILLNFFRHAIQITFIPKFKDFIVVRHNETANRTNDRY